MQIRGRRLHNRLWTVPAGDLLAPSHTPSHTTRPAQAHEPPGRRPSRTCRPRDSASHRREQAGGCSCFPAGAPERHRKHSDQIPKGHPGSRTQDRLPRPCRVTLLSGPLGLGALSSRRLDGCFGLASVTRSSSCSSNPGRGAVRGHRPAEPSRSPAGSRAGAGQTGCVCTRGADPGSPRGLSPRARY